MSQLTGGASMQEITFQVERDEEAACFVASWDDPSGKGGITTEGSDLREPQEMIPDAATGYFRAKGVAAPPISCVEAAS
jgi:hypothetical protein